MLGALQDYVNNVTNVSDVSSVTAESKTTKQDTPVNVPTQWGMNSTIQVPVTENKESVVPAATTLSGDEPTRQSTTTKQQFVMSPPREPQSVVGNEPDKFAAPVVKLTWEEIYARVSIILATVQPVKYHHVLGTGRRDDPLTIELSTEEPAVFGTWLKSGKDCMAIDKDGVVHWFRHDVKAGTLSYGTTFGCDYT